MLKSFLDRDKKRIVYKLEMIHKEKNYLAATTEVLSVYVDLSIRKVVEFEENKALLMDDFIESNKNNSVKNFELVHKNNFIYQDLSN